MAEMSNADRLTHMMNQMKEIQNQEIDEIIKNLQANEQRLAFLMDAGTFSRLEKETVQLARGVLGQTVINLRKMITHEVQEPSPPLRVIRQ